MFDVKALSKAYGDNRVINDLTVTIRRGERVGIIGENGVGKSTFLKVLAEVIDYDDGSVKRGHEVSLGYFAQDHKEILDRDDDTPLTWLDRKTGNRGITFTRGQLGRALFSGDDVKKPVAALSGGEAARLVFAGLAVDAPNTLLLDEPTNHLDIEAIAALKEALLKYEGTLVFVSHDRDFVDALATRIIEVKRSGVNDFAGTFSEYLHKNNDDHLDAAAVHLRQKTQGGSAVPAEKKSGLSWEEQKKHKARVRDLEKKRDAAMAKIEKLEAKKAAIMAQFSTADFYDKTDAQDVTKLQQEHDWLDHEVQQLMADWEACETELSSLPILSQL